MAVVGPAVLGLVFQPRRRVICIRCFLYQLSIAPVLHRSSTLRENGLLFTKRTRTDKRESVVHQGNRGLDLLPKIGLSSLTQGSAKNLGEFLAGREGAGKGDL